MGKVSDYVLGLVRRHLEEGGPVVWFDSDRTYESILACLGEDVPVFRYTDSFLRLRREVDPHMDGFDPPKILVYVPLDESDTHDALVELTAAGTTLRPGHPSHPSNTRLSVVARAALKGAVPDSSLDDIISKIDAGHLTLENLDDIGERGAPDLSGLSLVYESTQPDEITLRFLSDESTDQDLAAKGAIPDLKRMASEEYGADLGGIEDIGTIRSRLADHILAADCLLSVKSGPTTLDGITAPESPAQRGAVRRIAGVWRNRVDLAASYLEHARRIEATLDLSSLPSNLEALRDVETFSANDGDVQNLVATEVRESPTDSLVEFAKQRQRTFWGRQPESNTRWQLIASAGDLLLECGRVRGELGSASTAVKMMEQYTEGDHPWCELDTAQRRLERLYLEFEDIAAHPEIEKLASRARQAYQDVANVLSERFVSALEEVSFAIDGPRQRDTFHSFVKPKLEARVAYFLVDAMRYEMGRELHRLLADEGEASISGAVASVPTITEIGMASLLPEAEKTVEIIDAGGGKLALKVGGAVLANRAERMAFLEEHAGVPTAILKLEDFQPFRQAARKQVAEARLIVVTSQEIDMVGEADNSSFARQTMGQALDMLLRAVRALAKEGIEHFVLTADHGHLFAEETLSDMLLDKPRGGYQADLHRRCWVGHGGAVVPNAVRFKTTAFGLGGDLEIVTPKTLACFKAGGGNSFFHGGLSLQELIVPVVVLRARVKAAPAPDIRWILSGPKRVTTRVYSVSIAAEAVGLFEIEAPRVRVELWASGKKVGRLQDADYGLELETGDVALRTSADGRSIEDNHVTFLLEGVEGASGLEVRLVDARTDRLLGKMERVEVAISL